MKKIIGLIALVLLALGGYKEYKYYESTYSGVLAYAVVPQEIPTKTQTKDNNGKVVDGLSSYIYQFNFIKEDGQTQSMDYELSGSNPTPLTPGSIIQAKISEKRVVEGPNTVDQSEVPQSIMEKLK